MSTVCGHDKAMGVLIPQSKGRHNLKLLGAASYVLAFFVFLQFAQDGYTTQSRIIAWLIFVVGTLPMFRFLLKGNFDMPVLELVLLAYVNAFSLPVFFETQNTLMVKTLYPVSEPVTECLFYALLAISALWFGYSMSPSILRGAGIPRFALRCDDNKLFYFGVIICLSSPLVQLVISSHSNVDAFFNIITSSDLGMAVLALLYYKTKLSRAKKIIIVLICLYLVLKGVVIGMTQAIMQPLLIWYICRWLVTRKFEFRYILLGVLMFVLLQPVKLGYRAIAWSSGDSMSTAEKIVLFSDLFDKYWLESDSIEIPESASTRTSLLLQTAHVIDWTPHVVPYQDGGSFYFMLVTWIPRFIWPDKPVAQQANIDFAIDYGITSIKGIETTMFGVGELGEVFMNFGPLGILPMFILIGMLTYIPKHIIALPKEAFQRLCVSGRDSGIAPMALLLSVLLKLIFIGSTMADAYGGMIQLIVVQGAMLYLFTSSKRNKRVTTVQF